VRGRSRLVFLFFQEARNGLVDMDTDHPARRFGDCIPRGQAPALTWLGDWTSLVDGLSKPRNDYLHVA